MDGLPVGWTGWVVNEIDGVDEDAPLTEGESVGLVTGFDDGWNVVSVVGDSVGNKTGDPDGRDVGASDADHLLGVISLTL